MRVVCTYCGCVFDVFPENEAPACRRCGRAYDARQPSLCLCPTCGARKWCGPLDEDDTPCTSCQMLAKTRDAGTAAAGTDR